MKSNFQRKNLKFLFLKVIFYSKIGKFKPKYSVYLLDLFPCQQRNTLDDVLIDGRVWEMIRIFLW